MVLKSASIVTWLFGLVYTDFTFENLNFKKFPAVRYFSEEYA